MAETTVVISGGDEIRLRLGKIIANSAPSIMQAVDKTTLAVEAGAKNMCPVATGNLRGSIHSQPATREANAITGEVTVGADYGVFVECGTGQRGSGSYPYGTKTQLSYRGDWAGQVAQPYLVPSLLRNANLAKRLVAEAINDATKG